MATRAGDESEAAARRLRRALIAIVALVLWGFGTHGTHAGSGDEPHYLAIAHSLAFDGDLDLANNYGAREPLIAGGSLEPGLHVRAGRGGALRPVHDVGLPALFVPFVRVAAPLVSFVAARAPERLMRAARLAPTTLYRHVVSLGMIALAAVLAGLLYDAMRALGGPSARARGAFAAALLLMASPPLVAYSTLFFTELTSALLAFYAFRRLTFRPASTAPAWIATAAAIGLLLLVHVRNVGLVLGLTLVALRVLRQHGTRREAMAFGATLGAMLVLRTTINLYLWDTWMTTPHAAAGEWGGLGAALRLSGLRLVALLADQEYGLLIYAPIYLLAIAGLPLLEKRAPAAACVSDRGWLLSGVRPVPADERARLVGAVVPGRTVSDADRSAAGAAGVPRAEGGAAGDRGARRRADCPQRGLVAEPEAAVERWGRPRGVLHPRGEPRVREAPHLRDLGAVDLTGSSCLSPASRSWTP